MISTCTQNGVDINLPVNTRYVVSRIKRLHVCIRNVASFYLISIQPQTDYISALPAGAKQPNKIATLRGVVTKLVLGVVCLGTDQGVRVKWMDAPQAENKSRDVDPSVAPTTVGILPSCEVREDCIPSSPTTITGGSR